MNSWPMAPHAANPITFLRASGCRDRNEMADDSSVSVEGGMGNGSKACRIPVEDMNGIIPR